MGEKQFSSITEKLCGTFFAEGIRYTNHMLPPVTNHWVRTCLDSANQGGKLMNSQTSELWSWMIFVQESVPPPLRKNQRFLHNQNEIIALTSLNFSPMFEKFKIYAMSPNLEFRYDSECGISIQHSMWNSVVKQQRVPPACDQVYRQNSDRKPDRGTKSEFGFCVCWVRPN